MVNPVPPKQPQGVVEPIPLHPTQSMPSMQAEQMHLYQVLILLESMVDREEATVKVILGHLYDIGSINLINRRVRIRPFNQLAKWIARLSRPIFKIIALRWFKRNSPRLITNWLHSQVKFEPRSAKPAVKAAEAVAITPVAAAELEQYRIQVRSLDSRVRLLTALLIGVTCTLGTGLIWTLSQVQSQSSRVTPASSVEMVDRQNRCRPLAQPCP
jgi:hypothetical protein